MGNQGCRNPRSVAPRELNRERRASQRVGVTDPHLLGEICGGGIAEIAGKRRRNRGDKGAKRFSSFAASGGSCSRPGSGAARPGRFYKRQPRPRARPELGWFVRSNQRVHELVGGCRGGNKEGGCRHFVKPGPATSEIFREICRRNSNLFGSV